MLIKLYTPCSKEENKSSADQTPPQKYAFLLSDEIISIVVNPKNILNIHG